jgi:hypothetical protein
MIFFLLPAFVILLIVPCVALFIVLFAYHQASSSYPSPLLRFARNDWRRTVLHCKSKLHNYHINSFLNICGDPDKYWSRCKAGAVPGSSP